MDEHPEVRNVWYCQAANIFKSLCVISLHFRVVNERWTVFIETVSDVSIYFPQSPFYHVPHIYI